MRFLIIDAATRQTRLEDHEDLDAAKVAAGLPPREVDHGSLGRGLSIVVYEFGLFKDPATEKYFAVHDSLYAGNAVIYAYDEAGETTDFPLGLSIAINFHTGEEVIAAIETGIIRRPEQSVNGKVTWQWPDPAPADMPERARFGRT